MEQNRDLSTLQLSEIRSQFDEILIRHISRLLEIDTLAASISFNLPTISCLLLLVERENEIKASSETPPARYTRETFLDDLSDIGLEVDDDLMSSFKALTEHGYLVIDTEKRYYAQIAAFALVSFLNNLFPGMTGLNLVGYIFQMISEVFTHRKQLNEALEQLDRTLLSQGIPLSRQKIRQQEKESLKKQAAKVPRTAEPKRISDDVKGAFIDRLSRLRNAEPEAVKTPKVFQNVKVHAGMEIKELYPKRDIRTNVENESPAPQKEDSFDNNERETIKTEMKSPEIDSNAVLKQADLADSQSARKEMEIAAREAEIAAREAEIRTREDEWKKQQEQLSATPNADLDFSLDLDEAPAAEISPTAETEDAIVDIEKQIKAFQETLSMDCPICRIGKIHARETDTGRFYYSCSNTHCGFISWGKPYAFQCPLCRNPFLIEMPIAEDRRGLKCPRATCSFEQNHLGPPTASPDATLSKKRKKLVRRVRKK